MRLQHQVSQRCLSFGACSFPKRGAIPRILGATPCSHQSRWKIHNIYQQHGIRERLSSKYARCKRLLRCIRNSASNELGSRNLTEQHNVKQRGLTDFFSQRRYWPVHVYHPHEQFRREYQQHNRSLHGWLFGGNG